MNIKTLVAVGATMVITAMSGRVFAQDDLDDLLKALEGETEEVAADDSEEASEPAETEEAEAAATDEEVEEASAPEAEASDDTESAEEADAEDDDAEAEAEEETGEEDTDSVAEPEEGEEAEASEEAVEGEAEADESEEVAETTPAAPAEVKSVEAEEAALEAETEEAPADEEVESEEEADAEESDDEEASDEAEEADEEGDDEAEAEEESDEEEEASESADEDDTKVKVDIPLEADEAAEVPVAEDAPLATETPAESAPQPAQVVIPDAASTETLLDDLGSEAVVMTAEERVAVDTAAAGGDQKKSELIANIRATENIRINALEIQAKRTIADAQDAMKAGDYTEAARYYLLAYKWLGDRPTNRELKKTCERGVAEALYREAMQCWDIGRRDSAKQLMQEAVKRRHPKAASQLEKWLKIDETEFVKPDLSAISHRRNEADYKADRANILKHLRRSRQYLAVNDIDKALEECEIVIVNDPYNTEAIRLRRTIIKKRQKILDEEAITAREGMIADVGRVWRPLYAPGAKQLEISPAHTTKVAVSAEDIERTQEQDIEKRMKEMRLPEINFRPPATIVEAVEFFRQASKDFDRPDIPIEKRGFNFVLRLPEDLRPTTQAAEDNSDDEGGFGSAEEEEAPAPAYSNLPPIPTISATDISFYEALKLVTEQVNFKVHVKGSIVMIMHKDDTDEEFVVRTYNVPDALSERVTSASSDIKEMRPAGGFNSRSSAKEEDEDTPERDWKTTFEELGVEFPKGSKIMYIKSLGKLRVRNTKENLAELEKVIADLGGVKLVEIETRFVEVAQEDLNSLGFEWILNNDLNIDVGSRVGKALGVKKYSYTDGATSGGTTSGVVNNGGQVAVQNSPTAGSAGGASTWKKGGSTRNVGLSSMGGTSEYGNGSRYLSTPGNHISGEGYANNDKFMQMRAFLGSADLSMILHMLSQRSDTDLLSAPKVVTRSGETATIKVVTEYIYPTDYDVQLQSSSSSSGNNGGSQSAILAIVEPSNFQMREVGVILTVTPRYTDNDGGLIDLELSPQVVDEPTWKNYGMKIPFTGNSSLQNFEGIGDIFTGLSQIFDTLGTAIPNSIKATLGEQAMESASSALAGLTSSTSDNMTYYDAPMEQPFFHIRSIDTKVQIQPGSTVVLGGLISEQRKAMDDKVPFLGDLPFVGRLFRSHAEQTVKRNLLIFVTGRLITPSGREFRSNDVIDTEEDVTAAPTAD